MLYIHCIRIVYQNMKVFNNIFKKIVNILRYLDFRYYFKMYLVFSAHPCLQPTSQKTDRLSSTTSFHTCLHRASQILIPHHPTICMDENRYCS